MDIVRLQQDEAARETMRGFSRDDHYAERADSIQSIGSNLGHPLIGRHYETWAYEEAGRRIAVASLVRDYPLGEDLLTYFANFEKSRGKEAVASFMRALKRPGVPIRAEADLARAWLVPFCIAAGFVYHGSRRNRHIFKWEQEAT